MAERGDVGGFVAIGQRVSGRAIKRRIGRIGIDPLEQIATVFIEIEQIDTRQPGGCARALRRGRCQAQLQVRGPAITRGTAVVVVGVGRPARRIAPVRIKTVEALRVGRRPDGCQRVGRPRRRHHTYGCARGALRVLAGPIGQRVPRVVDRKRVIAIAQVGMQERGIDRGCIARGPAPFESSRQFVTGVRVAIQVRVVREAAAAITLHCEPPA